MANERWSIGGLGVRLLVNPGSSAVLRSCCGEDRQRMLCRGHSMLRNQDPRDRRWIVYILMGELDFDLRPQVPQFVLRKQAVGARTPSFCS
jgi:hypothetical protein